MSISQERLRKFTLRNKVGSRVWTDHGVRNVIEISRDSYVYMDGGQTYQIPIVRSYMLSQEVGKRREEKVYANIDKALEIYDAVCSWRAPTEQEDREGSDIFVYIGEDQIPFQIKGSVWAAKRHTDDPRNLRKPVVFVRDDYKPREVVKAIRLAIYLWFRFHDRNPPIKKGCTDGVLEEEK